MVHSQLGQQLLVRTTETSLEPRAGTRSCLSARPPALATVTAAQPKVACVRPSIVPFLYSKRIGGDVIPGFAFKVKYIKPYPVWTIDRFVAMTSGPLANYPGQPPSSLNTLSALL